MAQHLKVVAVASVQDCLELLEGGMYGVVSIFNPGIFKTMEILTPDRTSS